MLNYGLLALLLLSLVMHAIQYRHYQASLKTNVPKKQLDVTAEELLRDLVSTGAVVRIERIDPGSMLLWRNH